MTGHLQIKRDKYYMVLDVYENGKRKQKWLSTGLTAKGNKRRAEQMLREKLTEAERQAAQPQQPQRCEMTVADCVRHWLTKAQRRVDEVTYLSYVQVSETQVLPYYDACGLLLTDCNSDTLQAFFDEKQRSGRLDGKGGLAPATLRHLRNVLHQSFDEAVRQKWISHNPCEFVELPKKQRYEASFYTAEQLRQLFETMQGDPMLPLVRIAALYGLRRSEVLGLKWDSIDFTNGLVFVRHTVCKLGTKVEKDKTKTNSSRRSFPMTQEARELFLAVKAEEDENRRLFGKGYQKNDYVFKWPDGHPFEPDYVTRHFAKVVKRSGLPYIRFHDLRHSCASLLLNSGFNFKDIQDWLGHSDIGTTMNIYGHLDTARKQSAADKLSSCLSPMRDLKEI